MERSKAVLLLIFNALFAHAESTSVFTKSSNDSLLWGAYRPGLYLGIRPRLPDSLTTSLLWARVEDYHTVANDVRFTCEQHTEMAGYGWDLYDARRGGVQTIRDSGNGIDMETSFVKFDGGGWGARVKGTVRSDASPELGSEKDVAHKLKTAVVFSVGIGGLGRLEVQNTAAGSQLGFAEDVRISGEDVDLGQFTLTITDSQKNSHPVHDHLSYTSKPLDRTFVHSSQVPPESLWQDKDHALHSMTATIDAYVAEFTQDNLPPPWQMYTIQNKPGSGNSHLVQKVFEGSFEFEVLFAPSTGTSPPSSATLTSTIEGVINAFNEKFSAVFPSQSPFTKTKYLTFAQNLFSNLIGGLGYFQGDQTIDRSYAPEYKEDNEGFHHATAEARARNEQTRQGPYELFTSVPSRPFFPRGFLWDEGFHLLPIADWDPELAMQVISSWFNIMDEDGWIAREVILGNEARSKVPAEFQTQYPHYANPPTLFITIEALLDKAASDENTAKLLKVWLTQMYPLMQRNYNWYRRTQSGDLKTYDHGATFSSKEGYRWRGRTPQHILTSGLDDYPRAQPPHPGELHIDLLSWIGVMTRSLSRVAAFIDETQDSIRYQKILTSVTRNIDDLHWSKANKTYCDVTIDEHYEESVHVCHKGYVSLFPFLTGLMGPEHEHLGEVLNLIKDKQELWSEHGIRSLSKKDEFYGTGENYWKSPVWMNINYLILTNLLDIAQQPGPHQSVASKTYTSLRKNLVETVYQSWEKTGFAWEQYDPDTGAGQRTRHFTGWTSLVVKMVAMPEVPKVGEKKKAHDEL